jgi:hypothetical protein
MPNDLTTIAGVSKELGERVFEKTKEKLEDVWEDLLIRDRQAIERACKRMARLTFEQLAGRDVERSIAVVEATLTNYLSVGVNQGTRVSDAFWESVYDVIGTLLQFLIKFMAGKAGIE